MSAHLDSARAAALAGGRVILDAAKPTSIEEKGAGDYVSSADHAAESAIIRALTSSFPDIPVVAEEAGGEPGERYWLVDPLDGTTNFLHGFPIVGVSVALVEAECPTIAVVHAPFLDMTFLAVRGEGAQLVSGSECHSLRVSRLSPERAILATGFPFRRKELIPRHLRAVERCLSRFEDLRRPGAASLDLAWVAAGVFEGFFELDLSPWDVAAGALLVEEAGGIVTDWEGGPDYLRGNILAASPAVHAELVQLTEGEWAGEGPGPDAPKMSLSPNHPDALGPGAPAPG